jgi:hypothetical protein
MDVRLSITYATINMINYHCRRTKMFQLVLACLVLYDGETCTCSASCDVILNISITIVCNLFYLSFFSINDLFF